MKILIVDDDPAIVGFFKQAAQLKGIEDIDVAFSATEALTRVIRQTYCLITLDINMPGVTGLEILPLMRNLCSHAIIVIISGHIPDDLSPEVSAAVDAVLSKPVNMGTFHDLLDEAGKVCEAMEQVRAMGQSHLLVH